MSNTNTKYRSFMFTGASNSERLLAEYKATEPYFEDAIKTVLNNYHFREALLAAKVRGEKLRILNLGCGEGLYLHKLAEILEKADLLDATEFFGLDTDRAVVSTAEEFAKLSKPARPYLHFYWHDLQQPLEKYPGLAKDGQLLFDFIFGMQMLSLNPNARLILERFYRDHLKPGGIVYFRDWAGAPGGHGYKLPHPAMHNGAENITNIFAATNPGLIVAEEIENWLQEVQASEILRKVEEVPWGGTSEVGRNQMRSIVVLYVVVVPLMVQAGFMPKENYDQVMNFFYKELKPDMEGEFTFITNFARKPAA